MVRLAVVMLSLCSLAGIASLAQHHSSAGNTPSNKPGTAHERNSFDFVAHGPYDKVFPLFGGWGEKAWAGAAWDPSFIYPQPPGDQQGEVFTISHGATTIPWINTAFDSEKGHVQYVYFVPDTMVTLIDIQVRAQDANTTKVSVTYDRTSLQGSADEQVKAMAEHARTAGSQWGEAIDEYLKTQKH